MTAPLAADPVFSHRAPLVSPDDVETWLPGLRAPVALTGGTGFVGSHLVDTLCAAGVDVRVLARDPERPRWIGGAPARLVEGSLEDAEALRRLVDGAGTVVHLAGVLRSARAREFDRGNRGGTAALAAAVGEAAPGARLVHVSSLAAAGPSPGPDGRGPEATPRPISDYGRSKLAAETALESFGGERVVLRPPAIYGPRDTDVLEFFRMAARGVAAVPAGERWLTVAWVGDVVRAIVAGAAGAAPAGAVLHLGEPAPRRLDDALRTIAAAGGARVRVVAVPAAVIRLAGAAGGLAHRLGMHRLPLTADKAREVVARHWTAVTRDSHDALGIGDGLPLEDGATRTWEWYRRVGWV